MLKRLVSVLLSSTALVVAFGMVQANAQPTVDGKAIVCGTFDQYGVNAKSVKWIGDYLTDRVNQTPSGAVMMIQISINMYCPNYQQAFDDLNSQLEKNQHPGNPLFN
jgi:hypothetical protein